MEPTKIILGPVKKGDVFYITACSQCASKAVIKINGLEDEIVLEKTNNEIKPQELIGGHKFSKCKNDNLELSITIDNGSKIKVIKAVNIMPDDQGIAKGINFSLYIEDQEHGDDDYNDYCINIFTWHKQG